MKTKNRSLLLTSASSKVPLVFSAQRSLRSIAPELKLLVGDTREDSLAFHFNPHTWTMPKAINQNLDIILDGCVERNVKLILPTRDGELMFFSQHKEVFESKGIAVLVSNALGVNRCIDKLLFYNHLNEQGFPTIPTTTEIRGGLGTQFVIKERYGSGSIKVQINVSAADVAREALSFQEPIIQPLIRGREFSVDIWVSIDGNCAVSSPRFRDYVVDGEAKVTSTFQDEKLEKLSISIARALGLSGLCVLQGFILEDESYLFMECNARIGGATTASINSGVPLMDLLIADALELDVEPILNEARRRTLRQVRAPFDYCF